MLILQYNELKTLPDCLSNLTQLTTLDLTGNQLTSLPESFGKLSQLTHFWLDDNKLTSLPVSILESLIMNRCHKLYPALLQVTQEKTGIRHNSYSAGRFGYFYNETTPPLYSESPARKVSKTLG